jgi:hypothetical protein
LDPGSKQDDVGPQGRFQIGSHLLQPHGIDFGLSPARLDLGLDARRFQGINVVVEMQHDVIGTSALFVDRQVTGTLHLDEGTTVFHQSSKGPSRAPRQLADSGEQLLLLIRGQVIDHGHKRVKIEAVQLVAEVETQKAHNPLVGRLARWLKAK